MRTIAVAATFAAVTCAPAYADVVTDWNVNAYSILQKLPRPTSARGITMVHLAMFDALDASDPRYASYTGRPLSPAAGASGEAAASSAAAAILRSIAPAQTVAIDAALATALANVPDGSAKSDGIRLGERAAGALLALRSSDIVDTSQAYAPKTGPGAYVPTSTEPMLYPRFARLRPFALPAADVFRPTPPDVASPTFAADVVETRRDGARTSTTRTAEQTAIALYHPDPGAPQYNAIARQLQGRSHLDLLDSARAFALLEMALCDGQIALWDAKFFYERLRPETAIAIGGAFYGHPEIAPDPTWKPLLHAPMHPEYPCAHCGIGAAAASVLTAIYGDVPFVLTNPEGVTRSYASVDAYRDEEARSRLYAGLHFRSSIDAGTTLGKRVGAIVIERLPPR